mgnify:CR=1 FL=1
MAKRRSARQWASILESYRGSGLTQAEFCRRKGVALATLGYQLRRDRSPSESRSQSENSPVPQLLEVTSPAADSAGIDGLPIQIEVPTVHGQAVRIHCHSQQVGDVLRQVPGVLTP